MPPPPPPLLTHLPLIKFKGIDQLSEAEGMEIKVHIYLTRPLINKPCVSFSLEMA